MLKVIELFAGVGSQTQALKNTGVEHKVIGISEIDKYAISSYKQLHGDINNFGDISKIDKLPQADLWTYSFPCQDLSLAGKNKGIKQGTRSGLLLEVERLLEVSEKPKYLLMENVKNLLSKKHKADFDKWCEKLKKLGYTNFFEILNAKNFGVPQNRERVFMVSILGECVPYEFPEEEKLEIKLKDVLEETVEEKYYLKKELVDRFVAFPNNRLNTDVQVLGTIAPNPYDDEGNIKFSGNSGQWVLNPEKICNTLAARDWKQPKQIMVDRLGGVFDNEKRHQAGSVYNQDGLSPTITAASGGYVQPLVVIGSTQKNAFVGDMEYAPTLTTAMGTGGGNVPMIVYGDKLRIKNGTKQGYIEAKKGDYINVAFPGDENRRARVINDVAGTVMCTPNGATVDNQFRIRKLTPRECWRLMGWTDEQFDKIKGISNTQLYKQAGNGIVVNVLEKIFEKLFLEVE